jgi:transcription antitermination factor NusA-like protein
MKAPICEKCIQSNELCPTCKKKLDSGKITDTDISVAHALHELYKKHYLEDFSFERTLIIGDNLFVFTKGDVAPLIGKGGRIVRSLSEALGKKVRILEITSDMKTTIKDLTYPVRLKSMSTLFTPEGETLKLVLDREDEKKLSLEKEIIKEILHKLFSLNSEVVFE